MIALSETTKNFIHEVCKKYRNDEHELINVLHETQDALGYLPIEVQHAIASELDISDAKVYGVVTFYSFFTMLPRGKFDISICMGTACYVKGNELILDEFKRRLNINVGETTRDGIFTLSTLRCVGACSLAPVVSVGNKVFGNVTPLQVKKIIDEYVEKAEELS
jgi:NADH-quinone oxidoreductase subunit E/NADP-reducing hydrogenase subunit HndA